MEKLEAFRRALSECGDLPPAELSALLRHRYGVKIETGYIPVFRAILRDRERLAASRQGRAAAAPAEAAGPSTEAA